MTRCQIIAELATNHTGNVGLAIDMVRAAADAGASWVKTQGYQVKHLRPSDPQYDWLRQCELSDDDHRHLRGVADECGVRYLSTAYHPEDLIRLKGLGLTAVKIGNGEGLRLVQPALDAGFEQIFVSLAWGQPAGAFLGVSQSARRTTTFATVPLYPMPIECYARCIRREGWSDHAVGLDVAKIAIARGAQYVEKHFHLAGRGCREQAWNMTPDELRELVTWAERCAQACSGTQFTDRWTA